MALKMLEICLAALVLVSSRDDLAQSSDFPSDGATPSDIYGAGLDNTDGTMLNLNLQKEDDESLKEPQRSALQLYSETDDPFVDESPPVASSIPSNKNMHLNLWVLDNGAAKGAGCPSKSNEPCSGNGNCMKMNDFTCKCTNDATGHDCNIPRFRSSICPADCSGHGRCDGKEGVCYDSRYSDRRPIHRGCDPGWRGAACNEKTLKPIGCSVMLQAHPHCSGHGSCDEQSGACFDSTMPNQKERLAGCDPGWSGGDCSVKGNAARLGSGCPSVGTSSPCSGHGICSLQGQKGAFSAPGVCLPSWGPRRDITMRVQNKGKKEGGCDPGWEGKDCATKTGSWAQKCYPRSSHCWEHSARRKNLQYHKHSCFNVWTS